jgi:hypothetical protein
LCFRRGLGDDQDLLSAAKDDLCGKMDRVKQTKAVLEVLSAAVGARARIADLPEARKTAEATAERAEAVLAEAAVALDAAEERLAAAEGRAAEAAGDARERADAAGEAAAAAAEALRDAALREETWPREDGEALAAAVTALRRGLDARASKEEAAAAAEGVAALRARLRSVEARVDVAVDFVDWYAAKGEALEHNEGVIEAELARLAAKGAGRAAAADAARAALA